MIKKVEVFEYNGMLFKTKEEIDDYKLNNIRKTATRSELQFCL